MVMLIIDVSYSIEQEKSSAYYGYDNKYLGYDHSGAMYCFLFHSILQSIGSMPCDFKNSLAFIKCPQPKNPLYAERGLG